MAVTSTRVITITYSGDTVGTEALPAAQNASSAGQIEIKTLASGANTITVPTGGTVPTAVTIVPPSGNTNALTLKGVSGDTGIAMHLTDPTSLAIASSVVNFVINAGAQTTGVRFFWS